MTFYNSIPIIVVAGFITWVTIKDIKDREIFDKKFDFVLYGDGHIYGEEPFKEEIDKLATHGVWIIDGHDLYGYAKEKINYNGETVIGTQFDNCFKRELVDLSKKNVYETGFGIPKHRIREIDLSIKDQLFQKTAPAHALFQNENINSGYIFTEEEEYYDDMSRSWFGLTSKKGGWDCLRHYEIMSAGALLLFRDYKNKPPRCSPQDLPCFSYSTPQELRDLMSRLVVDNTPTREYKEMLHEQRKWLEDNGTTNARANKVLEIFRNIK